MVVYRLFWDEFSSWYLEMVKPAYGTPMDRATYDATLTFFDDLLRLLHPFMPFITEELWQNIKERNDGESIMYAQMPGADGSDDAILASMECAKEIITGVRAVRAQKNLSPKEALVLNVVGGTAPAGALASLVVKMANLSEIVADAPKDATAASFMVGTQEYDVPLSNCVDLEAERARIEKDIKYYEGFLQ